MSLNAVRRFPKGRRVLKTCRPSVFRPIRFSHTTASPLPAATFFNNTGKYNPTFRVRPEQFPILCSPLYDKHEYGWDWDHIQAMQEEIDALHGIILNDGVPALWEMLRLVGPELLYWNQGYHQLSPTMISAAEMGRVRILEALLDYHDILTPVQYDAGTPLTMVCIRAHADVVRLRLKRMPEVDINACYKFGYTPL
ncbi:hypothetical protein Sste5346_003437 [Sporothrix stenoceras]|uniref:Ankyrin repeat protein n=1 Tax=Sporothrix stenoceras TaxID=5173 RepID=A0ABR3ZD05_9PEZI